MQVDVQNSGRYSNLPLFCLRHETDGVLGASRPRTLVPLELLFPFDLRPAARYARLAGRSTPQGVVAQGIPAHAVAAGSTSPFMSRERASSRAPSSISESYNTTETAPTEQSAPMRSRDAFNTRSSNK